MVGSPVRTSMDEQEVPYGLEAAWERLIAQEISEEDVRELLDDVVAIAEPIQLDDADWVWERLVTNIGGQIMTTPPWQFERRPMIVPLVGPTGVGKTTTVAKLAANFKMLADKKVGLVTADTYRVAAVQQLRTYADIIGIDLHVVYTPEELKVAVDELSDHDL